MNELKEIAEKLAPSWNSDPKWEITEAEKHEDGSWTLRIYREKAATPEEQETANDQA